MTTNMLPCTPNKGVLVKRSVFSTIYGCTSAHTATARCQVRTTPSRRYTAPWVCPDCKAGHTYKGSPGLEQDTGNLSSMHVYFVSWVDLCAHSGTAEGGTPEPYTSLTAACMRTYSRIYMGGGAAPTVDMHFALHPILLLLVVLPTMLPTP